MIQGSAKAATSMAMRLQSDIRWCVSGTPFGNGKLEDLSALLTFLGQAPLNSYHGWKTLIGKATSQYSQMVLKTVCSELVLRRTKAAVEDEIGLPPQTEVTRVLTFNRVEVLHVLALCVSAILFSYCWLRDVSK